MKKYFIFIYLILCILGSGKGGEWISISSSQPIPAQVLLISSNVESSQIRFNVNGYFLSEVETPKGKAFIVSVGEGTPLLMAGAPDLPKLTASVIIPDLAHMTVKVISSDYSEYHDLLIAPSKGNFSREIDPATVPFHYGRTYNQNEFYPSTLAALQDPYILRDYRGQTVVICPFQYNPITRTLRVYHSITVEVKRVNNSGINPLIRDGKITTVDAEFNKIYDRHFINLASTRYEPLEDQGNMLIIAYGDFVDEMEPFVEWKRMTGMATEIMDVATIGGSNEIKAYVQNYYNSNGLTFLLLVGDAAQVPTPPYNTVSSSDNSYGYITGDDSYPEILVGRFSAENEAHVQTQVNRVLTYEKDPLTGTDWFTLGIGIASSQGPGDDNELDYEHVRNMQADLLNYTYTYCSELFDGSQGGEDAPGNPTPAQVAEDINAGATVILYTGHGGQVSWGTSGFSNSNINQLTNANMLPFIWSVACNNGTFAGSTCFAEAWLRATNPSGDPTGAIATLMSTVSQSWDPPMEGQDEMVDIMVESYADNIRRTFGGISMNGCMKMIDTYGNDGAYESDAWTVFGDPSLLIRTAVPQVLTVVHDEVIFLGATQFTVNCPTEDALVALTLNGEILGTGVVEGGTALIEFEPLLEPDTLSLVATAYNYIPYTGSIEVIPADGPYVVFNSCSINDSGSNGNGLLDYGEGVTLQVGIRNVGTESASDVSVVLSSTDPFVTITDNEEAYGTIAPQEIKLIDDAFAISVSNDIPDQHVIFFSLQVTDNTQISWNSNFSLVAHAPILKLLAINVSDPQGNNNNKLDPGESADLLVGIVNTGSADAYEVQGLLSSQDDYVIITSNSGEYGTIAPNEAIEGTYAATASGETPPGHSADFSLDISAQFGVVGSGTFSLIIGQIPVLIVDFDLNHSSAPVIQETLDNIGVASDYLTSLPDDLQIYSSIFVCLGIYWDNHVLSEEEGQKLADYLTLGGNLYMEGSDTWAFNPSTPVHGMFNINGVNYGSSDMGTINGQPGTMSESMVFQYAGENSYMDHIEPIAPAFAIFRNRNPEYGCAVAFDAGTYKTIGTSFEFGGLTDAVSPSTKNELMIRLMEFFGIQQTELGTVEGIVVDALTGEPLEGAEISVGSYRSYTSASGTYTGHFPVGNWDICGSALSYETICQSDTIYSDSTITCNFTLTYLIPPSNLQATLNENTATLVWEMEPGRPFNYFCIYRNKDNSEYQMIHTTTSMTYDDNLSLSGVYNYYITASYGINDESSASNIVTIEFTATGIANPGTVPEVTRLGSNFPNPFTEITKLRFDISKDCDVLIEIFKVTGEKVRTLVHENAQAGHYELIWNGKDDLDRLVPEGVYIYQLKAGNYLHSRKMILMK
jgi:hypothetical protein